MKSNDLRYVNTTPVSTYMGLHAMSCLIVFKTVIVKPLFFFVDQTSSL